MAEHIRRLSQSIEMVVIRLNHFIRKEAVHTGSALGRINNALVEIQQVVLHDISVMESLVDNYKQKYDSFLGVRIEHFLYFLDSADYHLDHVILRLERDPMDMSLYGNHHEYKGVMDFGSNAFVQAMAVFDILRLSLLSIGEINTMVPLTDLEDNVKKALPSSLWSSDEQWRKCEGLFEREAKTYKRYVQLLYKALHNWQESGGPGDWPGLLREKSLIRKHRITSLKQCVKEYKDTISKALDSLSNMKSTTQYTMNTGTTYDAQAFEDTLKGDLKAISDSAPWLHRQMVKYHANDISKLDLVENVLTVNKKEDTVRYMEKVLFKTDLDAIFKLRTEVQVLKTQIQKWYVAGVGAIISLLDYFERDELESKMRNLSLWRQPVVDFRTPEVLKYSYSVDETWRTWPASVPLQHLITPSGMQYISNILDGYMAGINQVLYEVSHRSNTVKDDAIAAFDALWMELQSYKRQSQIDNSFVRYSIV